MAKFSFFVSNRCSSAPRMSFNFTMLKALFTSSVRWIQILRDLRLLDYASAVISMTFSTAPMADLPYRKRCWFSVKPRTRSMSLRSLACISFSNSWPGMTSMQSGLNEESVMEISFPLSNRTSFWHFQTIVTVPVVKHSLYAFISASENSWAMILISDVRTPLEPWIFPTLRDLAASCSSLTEKGKTSPLFMKFLLSRG